MKNVTNKTNLLDFFHSEKFKKETSLIMGIPNFSALNFLTRSHPIPSNEIVSFFEMELITKPPLNSIFSLSSTRDRLSNTPEITNFLPLNANLSHYLEGYLIEI